MLKQAPFRDALIPLSSPHRVLYLSVPMRDNKARSSYGFQLGGWAIIDPGNSIGFEGPSPNREDLARQAGCGILG